jgi:hypothetical protein
MSKPNPGFEQLQELRHGVFEDTKSFSCVKEFTLMFPKKEIKPFILDDLKWNGKLFGGRKKI